MHTHTPKPRRSLHRLPQPGWQLALRSLGEEGQKDLVLPMGDVRPKWSRLSALDRDDVVWIGRHASGKRSIYENETYRQWRPLLVDPPRCSTGNRA